HQLLERCSRTVGVELTCKPAARQPFTNHPGQKRVRSLTVGSNRARIRTFCAQTRILDSGFAALGTDEQPTHLSSLGNPRAADLASLRRARPWPALISKSGHSPEASLSDVPTTPQGNKLKVVKISLALGLDCQRKELSQWIMNVTIKNNKGQDAFSD
ncbi:hypothetical protein AVEN_247869-1, partial [Araneus ventricosus]